MLYYFVIGLCIILLVAVIYISAKPISMGIEARRNIKENSNNEELDINGEKSISENDKNLKIKDISISDELIKLNKLKEQGILSADEYERAKKKLIS
jgi:p-aminobenzoyl-glutamate transporter AbgT